MPDTSFSYRDLHIQRLGPEDAPPIVVLHGWGSNATNMAIIAQALSDEYRVWNVDLPGHGFSPPPPEPWGVPKHAALVHELVTEECKRPVTLIGHSNGGRISLYLASDAHSRRLVGRLVLISPSGIRPRRGFKYHARRTTADILKAPFQILPESMREFGLDWLRHSLVWKALGSSDYRSLSGVMRETFVKTVNCYLDERVGDVQAPTLLFWGTKDEAVSRYQMEVLERQIADAGLVELEGAGHYGYLNDFDTFIAAARHFLEHTETPEAEAAKA